MPTPTTDIFYPDDRLVALGQAIEAGTGDGLALIDAAVAECPRDPRLHFLRGSVLASLQRYDEARATIRLAVELAPNYDIARFQLGFLYLTSGDAATAAETWRPLEDLPPQNPLGLFVHGLNHLARDEFAQAEELLRTGMALNTDYPPLNNDMRLILDQIASSTAPPDGDAPTSSVHALLQQASFKGTRH